MAPDPQDPRFAVGERPVNRRTALRAQPSQPAPVQPAAVRRQTALLHKRHGQDQPLAASLAYSASSSPQRASKLALACAVAGTVIAPLALFATHRAVQALVGCVALGLWGVAAWRLSRQRSLGGSTATAGPGFAPVAPEALSALDDVLEAAAPSLSEPVLAALQDTKATLLKALRASQTPACREALLPDDLHYQRECVRRYLPDALAAYLRVPADLREPLGAESGASATSALLAQLGLISNTLAQQLARCAAQAGDELVQQHRFLKAKADHGL